MTDQRLGRSSHRKPSHRRHGCTRFRLVDCDLSRCGSGDLHGRGLVSGAMAAEVSRKRPTYRLCLSGGWRGCRQSVSGAWAVVGALCSFLRGGGAGWRYPLGVMGLGLAASAGLAIALSAVQLLPMRRVYPAHQSRCLGGPHDIYPFSIEPFRLLELIWPNIFGIQFEGNTYWVPVVRVPGARPKIWVPSLYVGSLTFALGLCSLSIRRGPPWRVWLSGIVVVSVLASLGEYTSPIWASRAILETTHAGVLGELLGGLGPIDPDRRDANPPGWISARRRWRLLLAVDHRVARLPPISVSRQALHVLEPGLGGPRRLRLGPCDSRAKAGFRRARGFALCASVGILGAVMSNDAAILASFSAIDVRSVSVRSITTGRTGES